MCFRVILDEMMVSPNLDSHGHTKKAATSNPAKITNTTVWKMTRFSGGGSGPDTRLSPHIAHGRPSPCDLACVLTAGLEMIRGLPCSSRKRTITVARS
jgi:hypothetical protein